MKIVISDLENYSNALFVGCDEVGYGCLAGPLVVCGVAAPRGWSLEGLNDSKKLTEKKRLAMREKLNKLIEDKVISFHMAERSSFEIDKFGVSPMLKSAYIECMKALDTTKESLIITDGILKFDNLGVDDYSIVSMIKADTLVPTVMAASILAKTYRDGKMRILHELHPQYGWDSNVGYGSADHMAAMRAHGLSPLHRRSYKVKSMLDLYE